MRFYPTFSTAVKDARKLLLEFGEDVDAGRWQGVPTQGKPDLVTRELLDFDFGVRFPVDPHSVDRLKTDIQPNLPWADLEFEDRIGGIPLNPHHSLEHWPWWHGQYDVTASTSGTEDTDDFRFDHTYSERYWPPVVKGIRYEMGNLNDLINMLERDPYTRQAWFPIFYPEDTGAVFGGRVPCTLGYHFMLRGDTLNLWYPIRSCDYVRHFRDDIYLTCRLGLWVLQQLFERELRHDEQQVWVDVQHICLRMKIFSLHYHKGDEMYVLGAPTT